MDPEEFLEDYTRFCREGYGKKIQRVRMACELTQEKFAELLGTTRCTEGLWEVEYKNHHPKREMYHKLMKLAADKGVSFHDT